MDWDRRLSAPCRLLSRAFFVSLPPRRSLGRRATADTHIPQISFASRSVFANLSSPVQDPLRARRALRTFAHTSIPRCRDSAPRFWQAIHDARKPLETMVDATLSFYPL